MSFGLLSTGGKPLTHAICQNSSRMLISRMLNPGTSSKGDARNNYSCNHRMTEFTVTGIGAEMASGHDSPRPKHTIGTPESNSLPVPTSRYSASVWNACYSGIEGQIVHAFANHGHLFRNLDSTSCPPFCPFLGIYGSFLEDTDIGPLITTVFSMPTAILGVQSRDHLANQAYPLLMCHHHQRFWQRALYAMSRDLIKPLARKPRHSDHDTAKRAIKKRKEKNRKITK